MHKWMIVTGIVLVVFVTIQSLAVPQQVNYQGQLTSPTRTPLGTTVSMTFNLYTNSIGGNLLWTESRSSVSVVNGLFNVRLGQLTALTDAILNNTQLWLGSQVGTDQEMTPRARIVSVGYSFRTGTVDGASGGTITGNVNIIGKGNIGSSNSNEGVGAFVAGTNNHARGNYAVVCGGGAIADVDSNSARGEASMIPGGRRNETTGRVSFAGGYRAKAWHEGSFVWADASMYDDFASTGMNQFNVRASGGARIFTSSALGTGVTLAPNASSWISVSDSTRKRNVRLTDTRAVLDKLSQMPVKDWEYQAETPGTAHTGPMAQDFWNAFRLGSDSLGIATIDADGVMMAAIQELKKENDQLKLALIEVQQQVQSLLAGKEQAGLKPER